MLCLLEANKNKNGTSELTNNLPFDLYNNILQVYMSFVLSHIIIISNAYLFWFFKHNTFFLSDRAKTFLTGSASGLQVITLQD